MTAFSELTKPAFEQAVSWGAAAFGKSGTWEISVDETTDGPHQWRIQIECPVLSLYFPIPSPEVIGDAIQVLSQADKQHSSSNGRIEPASVSIHNGKENAISLLQDDEFPDRFFLHIHMNHETIIRCTVAQTDVACLIDALRQVQGELG